MSTDASQTNASTQRVWRPTDDDAEPSGGLEERLSAAADAMDRLTAKLDKQTVAQGLGWFSIGLGITQLLAPRQLGRAIGVGEHPMLMRLCGLREIASGVGLLSKRAPGMWAWSRVAGDAMDLALLNAAARSEDSDTGRIALAASAVMGVTALDVYAGQSLKGWESLETAEVEVTERVTINSSPQELYAFWRNLENLPRFMRHLESVNVLDERTSHWVARAPAGRTVEWQSEIVDDQPGSRLSWRTAPDSEVTHTGTVTFEPATHGRGTIVRVQLTYRPPAGFLGVQIARLMGEEPKLQIHDDLRRLKQLLETGEIATTEGQPSGKRSLIGRTMLGRRLQ